MARVCGVFLTKPWRDSEQLQRVRLWRVAPDAPTLGIPSIWMFPYWDDQHDYDNPSVPPHGGIIEGMQSYDKGVPPPNAEPAGTPCGRPEAWAEGAELAKDPPLNWRIDGFSTCCRGDAPAWLGGGAGALLLSGAGSPKPAGGLLLGGVSGVTPASGGLLLGGVGGMAPASSGLLLGGSSGASSGGSVLALSGRSEGPAGGSVLALSGRSEGPAGGSVLALSGRDDG